MKKIPYHLWSLVFVSLIGAAVSSAIAEPTTRKPSIQRYVSMNDSGQVAFLGVLNIGAKKVPAIGPIVKDADSLIFGWDSHLGVIVDPFSHYDIMGYADRANWRWISSHTYTNVINTLIRRVGSEPPLAAPGNTLLISGSINFKTDDVVFDPIYPIDAAASSAPATGSHTLRAYDANGTVLMQLPFTPVEAHADWPAKPSARASFAVAIPANTSLHSITIYRGAVQIAQKTASLHKPSVQLQYPVGGEVFGSEAIAIRWTGIDADNDPLTYTVDFSADDGLHWRGLTLSEISTTSLTINCSDLPGTTTGRLRIVASDGFNSASAQSGRFTISARPPSVSILKPRQNAFYSGTQQIELRAIANDIKDGTLISANFAWTSSIDGNLGTGMDLLRSASGLTEGNHLITAIATNSSGLIGTNAVRMLITRHSLPNLWIQKSDNAASLSWLSSASMPRAFRGPCSEFKQWGNNFSAVSGLGQTKFPRSCNSAYEKQQ